MLIEPAIDCNLILVETLLCLTGNSIPNFRSRSVVVGLNLNQSALEIPELQGKDRFLGRTRLIKEFGELV
jgi:hypothetical protein